MGPTDNGPELSPQFVMPVEIIDRRGQVQSSGMSVNAHIYPDGWTLHSMRGVGYMFDDTTTQE